jgi:hypothetical protein
VIGGPPIVQPYPQYQYLPPPVPRTPPRTTANAAAARQPRPPAVVRGQSPDEPPARPAVARVPDMPPPEALGVAAPVTELDWTDLRVKLDRLGATGFVLEKPPEGGYRFACRLPTAGGLRTVEGRAATEAEAVRRALTAAGR